MSKKTIWILNQYAVTPDLSGGTRHYDLGQQLIHKGYEVIIFASSFHYARFMDFKLSASEKWKKERIDNIHFVWLKTCPYKKNNWKRYVNMLSFMIRSYLLGRKIPNSETSIPKPDIIIGSSVHLLSVLSAYWLAKVYKARFIMEVRDLWPQALIDMGKMKENSPVARFLKTLEKFLYQKADKIAVVPPYAADYIQALGIEGKKIHWIPNGVNVRKFDIQNTSVTDKNVFVVMYVGTHGETNGLELLLQAAEILKDMEKNRIQFHLVGDGPEKTRLQEIKNDSDLNNVFFFDPVPKKDIPQVLDRADVLIHVEKDIPNLTNYGSSPNKFYDYMAAGKPLIVCSQFITDRIDKIGAGIHLSRNHPQELTEAILHLYNLSQEKRQDMGRRAKDYVCKNFDIEIIAQRLINNVFNSRDLEG